MTSKEKPNPTRKGFLDKEKKNTLLPWQPNKRPQCVLGVIFFFYKGQKDFHLADCTDFGCMISKPGWHC